MAQNIISKLNNKQSLTIQEQMFIDEVKRNPNHEAFKDLWLAGLI
jgi:hypothetical protein